MDFKYSKKSSEYRDRVAKFMQDHVYTNEQNILNEISKGNRWDTVELIETLKNRAKSEGLWNLFLSQESSSLGLSNVDYAPVCEEMGRSHFAPEIFNCSAPDTGNMELLARYADKEQQQQWLVPLLEGKIRSAFAMTEPDAASSDATNIKTNIKLNKSEYIINGHKWWTSGALDPRCKVLVVMGKTDPENDNKYKQQSMILVPLPHPGVIIRRMLNVFGFDHAPHGHAEIFFENVRVPRENIILGEGRGFEIAQGRLGPGRIHHCMRLIGLTERALERMCRRTQERTTFGKKLSEQSVTQERIAEARIKIDQARLLTLKAAWMMDTMDNKLARKEIAMIKVAAPNMACEVLDWAIQAFGGAGITTDYGLAQAFATARLLRIADGPDEVHRNQIARLELQQYSEKASSRGASVSLPETKHNGDPFGPPLFIA